MPTSYASQTSPWAAQARSAIFPSSPGWALGNGSRKPSSAFGRSGGLTGAGSSFACSAWAGLRTTAGLSNRWASPRSSQGRAPGSRIRRLSRRGMPRSRERERKGSILAGGGSDLRSMSFSDFSISPAFRSRKLSSRSPALISAGRMCLGEASLSGGRAAAGGGASEHADLGLSSQRRSRGRSLLGTRRTSVWGGFGRKDEAGRLDIRFIEEIIRTRREGLGLQGRATQWMWRFA